MPIEPLPMADDKPADGFSIEKGELFDAPAIDPHPILKLVQDSPPDSDLKALGIESSG